MAVTTDMSSTLYGDVLGITLDIFGDDMVMDLITIWQAGWFGILFNTLYPTVLICGQYLLVPLKSIPTLFTGKLDPFL